MKKIIIIGGGWAGCSAAVSAKKAGADVTLIERADMLLGTGLVGGIMRNNGRFTATEEMIAMGGGDLFIICDKNSRHTDIEFPGHKHANLYDIGVISSAVEKFLRNLKVNIILKSRVNKVNMQNDKIESVKDEKGNVYEGDAFIDTTGTAGPQRNCIKYGNGCAMCIIRCPSFGGRISIAGLAGVKEINGRKTNGSLGAMSGSCKIYKESLSIAIQNTLNKEGIAIIPIPENLIEDHLDTKACQQYALKEFRDNIILLDTGHAKLMSPFYSLEILKKIPGFENARYEDPYTGDLGNSMRYFEMSPRDNFMKVDGIENLFCAGEKAGLLVGHTEAIVTGTLAGHNSARYCAGRELFQIPECLSSGDAISYVKKQMETDEGMTKKYTFSGSVYFERMKNKNLYTIDINLITRKVENANAKNIFSEKIV